MVIPIYDTDPLDKGGRGYVNWAIMAICVVVFLIQQGGSDLTDSLMIRNFALYPVVLFGGAETGAPFPSALTLLTYMFLHGGWLHLIVNMIVLWSFGRGLEPVMGAFRFVVLYLVAGVLAALAHGFVNDLSNVILIGASGAIAGVLGAAVVAAPRLPVIFVIFPMPLWIAVIALVALHVAAIMFDWDPEIAWHAHLAGLAAGALLYPLLRRRSAV